MITGSNHLTISTTDLEESFNFYYTVLEFKPLMRHLSSKSISVPLNKAKHF